MSWVITGFDQDDDELRNLTRLDEALADFFAEILDVQRSEIQYGVFPLDEKALAEIRRKLSVDLPPGKDYFIEFQGPALTGDCL